MYLSQPQSELLLRESMFIALPEENPKSWAFERSRIDALYKIDGSVEDWCPVVNLKQQHQLLDCVPNFSCTATPFKLKLQSEIATLTLNSHKVVNAHLRGMLSVLFVAAHMRNQKISYLLSNEGDMLTLFNMVF